MATTRTVLAAVAVLSLQCKAKAAAPSDPVAATPVAPPPRRVLFDDVDVPDFLKNGA